MSPNWNVQLPPVVVFTTLAIFACLPSACLANGGSGDSGHEEDTGDADPTYLVFLITK